MASSFKDALEKTESGKVLIINFVSREEKKRLLKNTNKVAKKVKEVYSDAIALRIRTLKNIAHNMIVKQAHRYDIFNMAKSKIKELGIKGGQEYEKASTALKLMEITTKQCSSKMAFDLAVKPLLSK